MYGFTHRCLRKIHHRVHFGILSCQLPALVMLWWLCWRASFAHFTFSSKGSGCPERFAMHRHPSCLNFFYRCLMLFLTGGFLSNVVRKLRSTATLDCLMCVLKQAKAFSASIAAIFTQTTSLAAINKTNHPQHVIDVESFSFCVWIACWNPFRHSNAPILWIVNNCI